MASNNIKRLLWAFYASNHAFTKIRVMKSHGNRKGSEKRKNQIAEAIWFVVEMRGIEPLTS